MTHDELLEAVKDNPTTLAVVELHQQLDDNSCRHCVTWYPCDTIQAIERQLK